jgi:hypothetical protein
MTPGDFIDDYNERVDEPQRDDKTRWPFKRRHFPKHPTGLYRSYLDSLIQESHARREQQKAA